ncbi:MAG TPA: carboxypeptidase regulatory-like domain-containing protein [Terriglobia bacterium]|nr:carboxypeptidase regulatory-like domain-containing protein [Terriglobia bacterium]
MNKTAKVVFPIAILILICIPRFGFSQTSATGALTGTTTDATPAVVPGVKLTLTNEATKETRSTISSETGSYSFLQLAPGSYVLEAALEGFKTAVRSGVRIAVTETARLDIRLDVGALSETISVEAAPQMVQQETSALGRVVGETVVMNLPLVSRNFTQILGLSPGITTDVTNAAELGRGSGGQITARTSVNGSRAFDHNFQIDGVDTNDFQQSDNGLTPGAAIPNPDTIQEFKVQTGQADASFGRNAGANVNIITKSGANDFHGSLFEFFRNEALNANDFFFNRAGQKKPVVRQNQYGGTIGGPIKREKLLFFGSYQGTKQFNGLAAGKFNAKCSSTIFSPPLTNDRSAGALGALFAGRAGQNGGVAIRADGSNINPVALRLLNLKGADGGYLLPTPQIIDPSQPFARQGFSAFSQPCTFDENQYMVNLDFLQSEKSKFTLRSFYADSDQHVEFGVPAANVKGSPLALKARYTVLSLAHSYIFSPRVFNELRVGTFVSLQALKHKGAFKYSDIGVNAPYMYDIYPNITITGSYVASAGQTINYPQGVYAIQDHLSYVLGTHNVRFGGGVTRLKTNLDHQIATAGITFLSFPDFLLGLDSTANGSQFSNISGSTYTPGDRFKNMRLWDGVAYIQDDMKFGQRLSLNLGLRYERLGAVTDVLGIGVNFDPARGDPNPPAQGTFAGYIIPKNFCCGNQFPATGGLPPGAIQGANSLGIDGDGQNNFAPRVGFSWQVIPNSARLLLRGGYGVYYSHISGNAGPLTMGGVFRNSGGTTRNGIDAAALAFQNPFVPLPPAFTTNVDNLIWSKTPVTPLTVDSETAMAMDYRPPITQQYSVNVQTEVAQNLLLEVGYVGSRGTHLQRGRATNQALIASPSNPVRGITTNTVANVRQRVPLLGFAATGINFKETSGATWYNGLQTSLTKRMSRGLQFLTSYTWSKTMDLDASRSYLAYQGGFQPGDERASKKQGYGKSETSRDHRLVFSYVYEIPSVAGGNRVIGKLGSGWSVSGVAAVQSGTPLTILYTNSNNVTGLTGDRAQLAVGCTHADLVTSGRMQDRISRYFNPACFTAPPVVGDDGRATAFGNSGASIVTGPGQSNVDMSILKKIPLKESRLLEFRAEFFNLFNTSQFSNPDTNFSSSTFGQISSTAVNPRFVQFALKLTF